jgi:hypothetical protein
VGQPIPKDVLDDIESLHKTLTDNAGSAYNTKLDGINQNYHANFKPVPGAKKSATSGHSVGDVVNIGGKKVKITLIHGDGTFDGDEIK